MESAGIGMRIREARKAKGLSVAQLAMRADVSERYIWYLETGRRKNPSWETVSRLFDVLDENKSSCTELAVH